MVITDIKIHRIDDASNTKGLVSVTFDADFVVTGIKIMNSSKGLFISMPNRKTASGEYKDIAFPITKAFRELLIEEILNKYNETESDSKDEFIVIADDEVPFK